MGNSIRSKLFDEIECGDIEGIHKILGKHPELLDMPLGKDLPYNCLIRATWRGNLKVVKYLIEDKKADVNKICKKKFFLRKNFLLKKI